MIGRTFHGGRIAEARAVYGNAEGSWLDLSTGINPHSWPGADNLEIDWHSLPDDRALADLEDAAGAYFGIDPAHVCTVPGSEIGLRLLGLLGSGSTAYLAPSYRTHAEMAPGSIAVAPADLPACNAATIILANPNNPDGRLPDVAALVRPGRRLIVDEAFADPAPRISAVGHVRDDRGIVVVRSFGKFFGLAGVRLGFVIGPRPLVGRLRAVLGSWPVSAAALAIGRAAYRDRAWIAAMRRRLPADAAALDIVLARHGLRATGACPLFRLVKTDDAAALFDRLARRNILTRPFDYDARWLRLGLPGSDHALARLDRALADG